MNPAMKKLSMNAALGVALVMPLAGCWAVAAGVGAETAYVATQGERTPKETMNDQSITASVKTQLLADQRVSGLDINVDTFKSLVTLRGVVRSQNEVQRAIQIARDTSGVTSVESKLVVR